MGHVWHSHPLTEDGLWSEATNRLGVLRLCLSLPLSPFLFPSGSLKWLPCLWFHWHPHEPPRRAFTSLFNLPPCTVGNTAIIEVWIELWEQMKPVAGFMKTCLRYKSPWMTEVAKLMYKMLLWQEFLEGKCQFPHSMNPESSNTRNKNI